MNIHKIVSWNIRGAENQISRQHIRTLIHSERLVVVSLQEKNAHIGKNQVFGFWAWVIAQDGWIHLLEVSQVG